MKPCRSFPSSPLPLVFWLCAAFLAVTTAVRAQQEKTNIVFFLADDLGYMDVGFNNKATFYETPNLDRLAATGMVFTDFYAACQVCSPTRASIMTGKHPARLKTTNFFSGKRSGKFLPAEFETELPTDEITIAERLREAGYRTFFAGKWHLGGKGNLPTDQGFDINKGGGENGLPKSYFAPYQNVDHLGPGPNGEYLTERLAQESVDFLNETKDAPFFLYLSFYSVHTPLQAPEDLVKKYEAKAAKLGFTDDEGRWDRERQVWPDSDEDYRKIRIRQDHATYAAMVESLDSAVGRVLGKLDELGLTNQTAIFFTSDNGGLSSAEGWPTANKPLRGGKGWAYEGGVRVPMVARWPGVTPPGTQCESPATSTDFFPTVLEVAGLPLTPSQHMDGVSLKTLLKNPFAKFDRGPIFWHYPHYSNQGGFPASAVRDGDYKLIQDLEDGALELYNLKDDIGEHNNLEQLEGKKAQELLRILKSWRREVGARPLNPNPETGEAPPEV